MAEKLKLISNEEITRVVRDHDGGDWEADVVDRLIAKAQLAACQEQVDEEYISREEHERIVWEIFKWIAEQADELGYWISTAEYREKRQKYLKGQK